MLAIGGSRLPSLFHHIISSFAESVSRGKLNSMLSTIAVISPQTSASECNEGIVPTQVMAAKTPSSRKSELNFHRVSPSAASCGQRPMSLKVKRFSRTAHSKSGNRSRRS